MHTVEVHKTSILLVRIKALLTLDTNYSQIGHPLSPATKNIYKFYEFWGIVNVFLQGFSVTSPLKSKGPAILCMSEL